MRRRDLDAAERVAQRALSTDHFRAWLALKRSGPLTATQVAKRARKPGLHRRLSELRDMGWIREHGSTFCWTSYRHVLVWSALDRPRAFTELSKDEQGSAWFIAMDMAKSARAFRNRADAEAYAAIVIVARELRRYRRSC